MSRFIDNRAVLVLLYTLCTVSCSSTVGIVDSTVAGFRLQVSFQFINTEKPNFLKKSLFLLINVFIKKSE